LRLREGNWGQQRGGNELRKGRVPSRGTTKEKVLHSRHKNGTKGGGSVLVLDHFAKGGKYGLRTGDVAVGLPTGACSSRKAFSVNLGKAERNTQKVPNSQSVHGTLSFTNGVG